MEANLNQETPLKEEVVAPIISPPSKPNRKGLMVFGLILLLGVAAYAVYYFGNSKPTEEKDFSSDTTKQANQEDRVEEENAVALSFDFVGDYVSAKLPKGWSIVEYADGTGSNMLMDTDYQGLTGLSVLTEEEEEILKVNAVMGIGGFDICSSVGKFSDTSLAYIGKINNLTVDYNINTDSDEAMPTIIEIADDEYTEISFIDYRGRRVKSNLYFNDLDNANTKGFNPLCGLAAEVLTFKTLSFEYDSGMGTETGSSYSVKIMGDHNEETLLLLDEVMNSITL